MTREELIAALEAADGPSRELDATIAKDAGWHRVEPRHAKRSGGAWIAPEDFLGVMSNGAPILDSLHGTDMHKDVPRYTSSIDAALTLARDNWRVSMKQLWNGSSKREWSVTVNIYSAPPRYWVGDANGLKPNAAHAICIAVMRAMEDGK